MQDRFIEIFILALRKKKETIDLVASLGVVVVIDFGKGIDAEWEGGEFEHWIGVSQIVF